jgi:hypothetical protein
MNAVVHDLLPEWAFKRAAGLEIGAQLPTRDGRRTSNAHIVDIRPAPRGRIGMEYLILTDAGSKFIMSEAEVHAQYYEPEWVADITEIIAKFWRGDGSLSW